MSNELKFKISHKETDNNSSEFVIKPLERGLSLIHI